MFESFMAYPWPGNIRELEHCIERAVILSRGADITMHHIPPDIVSAVPMKLPRSSKSRKDEADQILKRLKETDWNKSKTARLMNISRRTLYQKIKKYGLPLADEQT